MNNNGAIHRNTDESRPRLSFDSMSVPASSVSTMTAGSESALKGVLMDFKFELVVLPVADVERAKEFYERRMGFRLDVDHQPNEHFRVVQLTPPGSACSISFGIGLTTATPGSVIGNHLVVTDIVRARDMLVARGVEVGDIRHMTPDGFAAGPDPEHARFNSFAELVDPDGNGWVLQEVPV